MESWRKNYDSYKLQTQEEYYGKKEIDMCQHCNCSIYEGEIYYDIDGTILCASCVENCKRVAG